MTAILIVEDDRSLLKGLAFDLAAEGYCVYTASDAAQALDCLNQSPSLVLLDVNLPDTDGFALCRKIRSRSKAAVIFLTARDLEEDELKGFDCGADDYVTKPFSMALLRKRIKAVLSRKETPDSQTQYRDGFLTIDFQGFSAFREMVPLSLTPTEYRLLKLFLSNPQTVLTRQLLLEKLWDQENNYVDEHTLTVNINRLRGKIEDGSHKYIKTIYGIGYLWMGGFL